MAAVSKRMRKDSDALRRETHSFSIWRSVFTVDTNYVPLKPMGRGSYGIVCSSINTETMKKVAIKKIRNVFESREDALKALREIVILKNVSHHNVIGIKDIMVSDSSSSAPNNATSMSNFNDLYIVYDLMDSDLSNIIESRQSLSHHHCKYFLFQLLEGLKYLHSAKILHRDLKPGNILVNADCELKICDFGLARSTMGDIEFMTDYVVTRWYRAPKLLLGSGDYGTPVDVWSVGCILAELLGREPIFKGNCSLDQLKVIVEVLGTQDAGFGHSFIAKRFMESLPHTKGTPFATLYPLADPLALDLLERMLVFDPAKRISVNEALRHPYLADLDDPPLPLDLNVEPNSQDDSPLPFDLNIDDDMKEEDIRELMWREMMCYNH